MADLYLAGVSGYFKLGTAALSMAKWTGTFETNLVPVNNYTGAGYQQLVAGITKGKVTASGPYNLGNMAMVSGASGTFHLGLNGGTTELTFPGFISKIELESDVDGRVSINIEGESSGSFTAAVT